MTLTRRFTVAVHLMALIHINSLEKIPSTVETLSHSTGVSTVEIRQLTGWLIYRQLLQAHDPVCGIRLAKPAEEITLCEILRASRVNERESVISMHRFPASDCRVGAGITDALSESVTAAEEALEASLAGRTLKDIISKL